MKDLKNTMRRRWAKCAGRNEHRSKLAMSNVSSSDSRELHKGKSLYSICSSRFPLELTRKLYIFLTSLLFITLTSSCSDPFPKGHLFDLMILQKLLPKPVAAEVTSTPVPPAPPLVTIYYIFITTTGRNGNLGGITGADTICQTEKTTNFASLPGNASDYKALLSSGTTRRACSTSNCGGGVSENSDWVLKANTDYYRLDGTTDTKLFTTNSSGIVNFNGAETLLAALDSTGVWWTGLDNDWVDSGFTCTGWTVTAGFGKRGTSASTTSTSIASAGTTACSNTTAKFICVRQ